MKRKKKRKEKKRNVNELKSQPSAKQSNTRRLLASNVLEIPTSSASPTIRGLSYASPETPVRDTLATPETRSILVETWSKIFRSRKKKKERVFQEKEEEEEERGKKRTTSRKLRPRVRCRATYIPRVHIFLAAFVRIAHNT